MQIYPTKTWKVEREYNDVAKSETQISLVDFNLVAPVDNAICYAITENLERCYSFSTICNQKEYFGISALSFSKTKFDQTRIFNFAGCSPNFLF